MIQAFKNEANFQEWVVNQMAAQGWDVQPLREDPRYPGIPDLSAAHPRFSDVWAELKCAGQKQSVHDVLHLRRPVTAQQREWLLRRAGHSGARCGILVAYQTSVEGYVSWCPIDEWLKRKDMIIMEWAMNPYTAKVVWLRSGATSFERLINGGHTPGWGSGN